MPKTFGRRRGLCFCFSRDFWGCRKNTNKIQIGADATQIIGDHSLKHDTSEQTHAFETKNLNPDCYEKLGPEMDQRELEKQLLKISELHKVYENGFKAVNGLNVKMYADQIFCLLGHNGAGKTTTISMLTGLLGSSKGEAELMGIDLFNKMDDARKLMGVCP